MTVEKEFIPWKFSACRNSVRNTLASVGRKTYFVSNLSTDDVET
jgi:hypothetical protein